MSLTILVELYDNGSSVRPSPHSESCHYTLVDIVRMKASEGDLIGGSGHWSKHRAGVHLRHLYGVVLDDAIGVLERRRVPGESDGRGIHEAYCELLWCSSGS